MEKPKTDKQTSNKKKPNTEDKKRSGKVIEIVDEIDLTKVVGGGYHDTGNV